MHKVTSVLSEMGDFLAQVNTILWARVDTKFTVHALLVIHRERFPFQLFPMTDCLHIDAINRAGLRTGIAINTQVLLKVMNPAITVVHNGPLLGILKSDGLREQVPKGYAHTAGGRTNGGINISEPSSLASILGRFLKELVHLIPPSWKT
jgi:hypothetical protein